MVVPIAPGTRGPSLGREDIANHFLDGGFSDTAGHANHQGAGTLAEAAGEIQQGLGGVLHDQQRNTGIFRQLIRAIHKGSDRATLHRSRNKIVTIKTRTLNRREQGTRGHVTTVVHDSGQGIIGRCRPPPPAPFGEVLRIVLRHAWGHRLRGSSPAGVHRLLHGRQRGSPTGRPPGNFHGPCQRSTGYHPLPSFRCRRRWPTCDPPRPGRPSGQ